MDQEKIIIIGAGAAGLMAARTLSAAGKQVIILEARGRIGGRIWPLSSTNFGYEAQAGAEFVHGEALVTKSLAQEAGMTLIEVEGDMWSSRDGEITINDVLIPDQDILHDKLRTLEEDVPISTFLDRHFSDERFAPLRKAILDMAQGYDAADPDRISTFELRDEWLGGDIWKQYRIKEGYGALLRFLESECREHSAEIHLNTHIQKIETNGSTVKAYGNSGTIYEGAKVIVTVPLPILSDITFVPPIPEKIYAASKMGFGGVIKILLRFKDQWWTGALGKDFAEMDFMFSDGEIRTWWTQHPLPYPVLTGWIAGPHAEKLRDRSDDDILDIAMNSLSTIFKVPAETLYQNLVRPMIANWPADPYARGAYSYATPASRASRAEILKPVFGTIFFAGEALYEGKETATVEGALASGLQVAKNILNI
ncbi:FAD-dependent oxidoreductase [Candidatus Kaiserbacteria bacterium]|nr:FAD-dependent oxidoreductase [Candidatus Kaiserbacteria bacterium]